MAIVFDCVDIRGLRPTHFSQLLVYLEDRKYGYYGNKEQFEKRHDDLKKWLEGIISYAKKDGVVIPKKP
jgi:hypothetical protein